LLNELSLRERLEEITPLSPPEDCHNLLGLITDAKRILKELEDAARARMQEIVEATPSKSVTLGHIRYYIGTEKIVKPTTLSAVGVQIFIAAGGSWEDFVQCLSMSAFKPGECRKTLRRFHGEEAGDKIFDAVFSTTEKTEVREGKPVKSVGLQRYDTRF